MKSSIVLAALLIASSARDARAQAFLNPYVDTTLTSPTATGSSTKAGFGIAFGTVGKTGGFETDIAYQPELIDKSANGLAKSHVFTFSGDFLIGPKIGPVKPYFAAGMGDLMLNVSRLSTLVIPNPESISNNYFTVNLGGGVIGFSTRCLTPVQVRADRVVTERGETAGHLLRRPVVPASWFSLRVVLPPQYPAAVE